MHLHLAQRQFTCFTQRVTGRAQAGFGNFPNTPNSTNLLKFANFLNCPNVLTFQNFYQSIYSILLAVMTPNDSDPASTCYPDKLTS